MQNVKPWQIVLFVAAIGAILFTGYRMWRGDGIDLAGTVLTVDIASGDLYLIDTNGRGIVLPAKHPETKLRTLFPIYEDEEGNYVLDGRGLARIQDEELQTVDIIDRETGRVATDGTGATRVNAKELVTR